jgi:hypothetical protein
METEFYQMYMDQSFDLASYDENSGQFSVSSTAFQHLASVTSKFKVFVIVGSTKGGKSSLLNILSDTTLFTTSAHVDACTLGLRAVYMKDLDILYIDSQGLYDGAIDDTKTIALCAMLADLFVYNSTGPIDSNKMNALADGVRFATEQSQLDSERIHSPTLLWLERDAVLSLGAFNNTSEYLESKLSMKSGASAAVNKSNAALAAVKQYFTNRHCIRLPQPTYDVPALQQLCAQDSSTLHPGFLSGVKDIQALMRSASVEEGSVSKGLANGSSFCQFLAQVLVSINSLNLPPGGIFAQLERAALASAKTMATGMYSDGISEIGETLPCEMDILDLKFSALRVRINDNLCGMCSKGIAFNVADAAPDSQGTYLFNKLCTENDRLSKLCCDAAYKAATERIVNEGKPVEMSFGSFQELCCSNFVKSLVGPTTGNTLKRFESWLNLQCSVFEREEARTKKAQENARVRAALVLEQERLRAARELQRTQLEESDRLAQVAEMEAAHRRQEEVAREARERDDRIEREQVAARKLVAEQEAERRIELEREEEEYRVQIAASEARQREAERRYRQEQDDERERAEREVMRLRRERDEAARTAAAAPAAELEEVKKLITRILQTMQNTDPELTPM